MTSSRTKKSAHRPLTFQEWFDGKVAAGIPDKPPVKHPFAGKLMGGIVDLCAESKGNLLTLWEYIENDLAPPVYRVDAQRILKLCSGSPMHVVRYAKLIAYAQAVIESTDSGNSEL